MIVDAHSHIRVDNNFKKNFKDYMEDLKLCNISKAIVSIDPFISELKCNKDYYHFVSINDKCIGYAPFARFVYFSFRFSSKNFSKLCISEKQKLLYIRK